MKTIGVLTSGGDAPGMNAALRAVVRTGNAKGMRVMGIGHGYKGLLEKEIEEMGTHSVSDIVYRGGTILRTGRSNEFATEKGFAKAIQICKEFEIEGLVTIGGDGTFRGARELSVRGLPCVAIPATIDNDIASTDLTIGFDTTCNTIANAMDKIRDTSDSHDRCFLLEVMGRRAGDLALHVGIACGALAILLPEMEYSLSDLIHRVKTSQQQGKNYHLIVVSEGVTKTKDTEKLSVQEIATEIEKATGINTRGDILGYLQRGGKPTVHERVLASEMGYVAVELLAQGIGNRVITLKENVIGHADIVEALETSPVFNQRLYDMAKILTI